MQEIEVNALCDVNGGAPTRSAHPPPPRPAAPPPQPHNRTTVHNNIGLAFRDVELGLQTNVDIRGRSYERCLDLAERRHWTAAETLQTCGRPPQA